MKSQRVIRFLWDCVKNKKYSMLLLLVVQLFLGVSGVLLSLTLRSVIDNAVDGQKTYFWWTAGCFAALIVIQTGMRTLLRYLEEYLKTYTEAYIKRRLWQGILRDSFANVAEQHSGEWLTKLTSDAVIVADGLVNLLPGALGMLVRLISTMLMLIVLLPGSGWIAIIGAGVLGVGYVLRKPLKQLHRKQQEADAKVRVFWQEQLEGFMLLKIYNAELYSRLLADKYLEEQCHIRMKRANYSVFYGFGFSAILRGLYLVGAIICGYGILVGKMSYGTFTAVLQLVTQLQAPLTGISGYVPKFFAMLASAERVLEQEQLVEEELFCKETDFSGLKIREVGFVYPGETDYILRNINLEVNKGEMVAIVGHSGCGKSTLMKLLLGLYPITEGEITTNSEMINIGAMCAYVPQGKYLLNGTIREIITLRSTEDRNAEEQLKWAIRLSCSDFVWELEQGLDTRLGERGAGLSEGQLQRLSIARAIYANRPVLILDEATSALDEETEWNILNNIRKNPELTILAVTHRPAALKLCDRIINLNTENQNGE